MSDKKTIRNRVVDPGYRLPATIEPGDDVCIRVYVPKDSLYLAAFWAQYERLGMWLAWERGGTRAKDAANAWKVRIAKARAINDCSEGDCGIMNVRQKPNYPCILQKWDDCESEWVDFADTRLCVPMMRVNGLGELEQWTGTEWVSAKPDEGAGGTYQPGHDLGNQLAVWSEPPAGQDGACLAAANAVAYLQAAIDASMIELKELPYLVRLLDSILTTWYWRVYNFAAFASSMVTGLIWSLSWEDAHKLMSDKSLTHEDDIIAVDITDDVLCLFYSSYEQDGTMTEAGWDELMVSLQDAIDLETPNTPKCIKLEWLMLLSFPGPTWMANIANNAGIDEADCADCGKWEYTFDWDSSQESWQLYPVNGNYAGAFSSPRGWYETNDGVYIERTFDETDVTLVDVQVYTEQVVYSCNWYIYVRQGESWTLANQGGRVQGTEHYTWSTENGLAINGVRLVLADWPTPSGPSWVEDILFEGYGDNPFV